MKIEEFCKKHYFLPIFLQNMEIKRNVAGSFELATSSVGVLGLEPRMTGPESVVLPLHHTPKSCFRTSFFRNAGAKVVFFFESPKVFAKKSQKFYFKLDKKKKEFSFTLIYFENH